MHVDAARRLLEQVAAERAEPIGARVVRVCEQLSAHLAKYVGESGVRALFERSLTLATRQNPWLADAQASQDEISWARLRASLQEHERTAEQAGVELIASLLTLLVTFVGEGLARRLLHQIFPEVFPLTDPKETT